MQLSEFKLDNLKNVIDQISAIVFSGSSEKLPSGTKTNKDGVDKTKDSVDSFAGEGVKARDNMEVYIAGKIFDVISSTILSANITTDISYSTEQITQPLGYGLQMFVSVSSCSFTNQSFFASDKIYEYLYICKVKFSQKQAKTEAGMMLAKLYQDQIAVFIRKEEDLLAKLSADTITPEAYESSKAIYDKLIAQSEEKIKILSS